MGENYTRPSWDDYFMAVARIVATRSTCDRLRAGAVLVNNKRIISTGYNGSPPGLPHCDGEEGHLMEEGHCVRTVHAEHNAILQAAITPGQSTKDGTMYLIYSPCIHCTKYLISAGIKRVVIGTFYRNTKVIEMLQRAGVQVDIYKTNEKWNEIVQCLFKEEIKEKVADEGYVKMVDDVAIYESKPEEVTRYIDDEKKEFPVDGPPNFGQIY